MSVIFPFCPAPARAIRSFVRRTGRITVAQRRALETLWPRYGVDTPGVLDWTALFGRRAPVHVEIGFGMGDALLAMAAQHPQYDYLGIEVHPPGVGRLLQGAAAAGLTNVRVLCADAVTVLRERVPPASVAAVYVFFPDPWPKKRHHKRRLIQRDFVALTARALQPGGILHLATDWEEYAQHMQAVVTTGSEFRHVAVDALPSARPRTKFEQRGEQLGHVISDLIYQRTCF